MQIVSVKFGWSNNSSSSHSIITGLNSWKNLSKDEIAEKFDPTAHMEYCECADIDEMRDIVAYALYCYIFSNFDYDQWSSNINTAHVEMQALTRGYSEPLMSIIMKAIPFLNQLYVSDDNAAAERMAKNNNMKDEEAFWHFVYYVAQVVD